MWQPPLGLDMFVCMLAEGRGSPLLLPPNVISEGGQLLAPPHVCKPTSVHLAPAMPAVAAAAANAGSRQAAAGLCRAPC